MELVPLNNRLVVEEIETTEIIGLLIPKTTNETRTYKGKVIALDEEIKGIKKGDILLWSKHAEEIIEKFIPIRMEYYTKRKEHLLRQSSKEATLLKNRVRFVREVVDGTLLVMRRTKKALVESLQSNNYDRARSFI